MKLPRKSKKAFSGEIFDVYQWPQKLYDGSTATFEKLKRPDTALIIPVLKDKVLLIGEDQPGKHYDYTLIGGRRDKSETPLQCAKREFLEETGMMARCWEKLYSYQPLNKIEWTIYYFIARDITKIQAPQLDPGEKIKLKPVSFDQFVKIYLRDLNQGHWLSFYLAKLKAEGKLNGFKKRLFPKL